MRFLKQKTISDIPKEILRMASRWGGVSKQELLMVFVDCDKEECSKEFRALVKDGKLRKVTYITPEEPEVRWVLQ